MNLLTLFMCLQFGKYCLERLLAVLNRSYYENKEKQTEACRVLKINSEDFDKTLNYTNDKYNFSKYSGVFNLALLLTFISFGGLAWVEELSISYASRFGNNEIIVGLMFFGIIGFFSSLISIPWDYYFTFKVEEKHGFNRQSKKDFFVDLIKNAVLGSIMGGVCLSGILWLMQIGGEHWWLWVWIFISVFMLLTTWLYPTLLAPLFNKFSPLGDSDLQKDINKLAEKVSFEASGVYVMDASKRSSHGNAYFTGIFGKKRIVLFDTLIQSMQNHEIVAVLAHELGHFKLKHVRWALVRGIAFMGLSFYLLSLCLPLESFYKAFHLQGVSNYGALFIFPMWFGLISFFISPFGSWISRKNEFAADAFAIENTENKDNLANALLKLRESNHAIPLSHPLYSSVYHSHPPLMERLKALKYY